MRIYPFFLPYAACPNRCRFCYQRSSQPLPSPAAVGLNLENLLPAAGDGEVAFYGGTFTLLPEELQTAYLRVAASYVEAGRVGGIRISTRPDALPGDVVQRLKTAGVTTVEIGCQSFSAEVLSMAGRGHGPDAANEAVAHLRQAGLKIGIQLMPGLPGGNRKEAIASLKAALALGPDFLRFYPAVVFRGTPLEADFQAGQYRPPSLEEAVDWCAEMLWHAERARVPVVRIGLQETPALLSALVAGPWHPAFGQLVRSRLWRHAIERAVQAIGTRRIGVAPADLADALGHRRENLLRLQRNFGHFAIVGEDQTPRGNLTANGRLLNLWETAWEPDAGREE